MGRMLPIGTAMILLAGCAADQDLALNTGADGGNPRHTYWYHDANHPDGVSQSTPQAEYNGARGTWLWPPAASDKPN